MKIYFKIWIGINIFLLLLLTGANMAKITGIGGLEYTATDSETDSVLPTVMPNKNDTVSMLAVGDIMLGRYVETLMNRHGDNYPFEFFNQFNTGQDVIIGNLEGPIVSNHKQTPDFTTSFSFNPKVATILKSNGFTHLSIANNHTFDRGENGFIETKNYLQTAGLTAFGNPVVADFEAVTFDEINQIKFAFVGINEAVSKYFKLDDYTQLIQKIKNEDPDVLVIVSIHWGLEYQPLSSSKQQEIATKLIEAGAETIIGHHPHVIQEVAEINGKMVFYSLGNFIFDQYFSKETQEGLAINLVFNEAGLLSYDTIKFEIDKSRPKINNEI